MRIERSFSICTALVASLICGFALVGCGGGGGGSSSGGGNGGGRVIEEGLYTMESDNAVAIASFFDALITGGDGMILTPKTPAAGSAGAAAVDRAIKGLRLLPNALGPHTAREVTALDADEIAGDCGGTETDYYAVDSETGYSTTTSVYDDYNDCSEIWNGMIVIEETGANSLVGTMNNLEIYDIETGTTSFESGTVELSYAEFTRTFLVNLDLTSDLGTFSFVDLEVFEDDSDYPAYSMTINGAINIGDDEVDILTLDPIYTSDSTYNFRPESGTVEAVANGKIRLTYESNGEMTVRLDEEPDGTWDYTWNGTTDEMAIVAESQNL